MQKKNDNNLKKMVCIFFKTVIGTFCATCTITGYSCLISYCLTFKTIKVKFKKYFLSIFKEDPSVATYEKVSREQFKFL